MTDAFVALEVPPGPAAPLVAAATAFYGQRTDAIHVVLEGPNLLRILAVQKIDGVVVRAEPMWKVEWDAGLMSDLMYDDDEKSAPAPREIAQAAHGTLGWAIRELGNRAKLSPSHSYECWANRPVGICRPYCSCRCHKRPTNGVV